MSLAVGSYVTLFAPLLGALVITLLGMRLPARASGWVASGAVLAGFLGAVVALLSYDGGGGRLYRLYEWATAGTFNVGLDLYIDPLSIFEMLVVTGVGLLIHVYSIGYMAGDPQERRFFAYMNIFVFAMLMLVMAGNFVFLLVGWGLVGMASYLLIGFWHDRPSAVAAAKKAFIMNAVGDVSLMLGLLLIFARTGALDYPAVFERLPGAVEGGDSASWLIPLLLLGGALAKSAQLPLHTWLPDAMEGPTPVSALIHAATMVTAGVYLVARMWHVFDLSEGVQITVALIGAVGLVYAGLVALAQTDIKRVIAYSTMSQIGYMFVAVGIGAYSAGMFHLMTHAFFKALLFLAAGIVIHALADEQDIRQMGGLKAHLPRTYWLFLVGSLALSGIIPFAGFFSKDEILAFALASGEVYGPLGYVVYALALFGVLLTGIYSFRLLYTVFHGDEGPATRAFANGRAHHGEAHADAHAHHGEAPATMFWPVAILGVASVVGGLLVVPGLWNVVGDFLHGGEAAPVREALHGAELHADTAWLVALLLSLPLGIAGIFVARQVWGTGTWAALRTRYPKAEAAFQQAMGWDALYDRVFYRPASATGRFVRRSLEGRVVAPSVGVAERSVRGGAGAIAYLQTGLVRLYAFAMALAVIAILVAFVWIER